MTNKFNCVLLMGRPGVSGVHDTLSALQEYLSKRHVKIYIDTVTATEIESFNLDIINTHNVPSDCNLIIVVGGDGSLLNASHTAIRYDLPVLGINRGRLGFLTDIAPHELQKVGDVLDGKYSAEKRFFLTAELIVNKNVIANGLALNDVVLLPGDTSHMIEFETTVNQQFVCNQRADGLIISTPTGSTAYALSGGGPILHPSLDAVVLVPMFPHTLSSRPIVIQATSTIEIHVSENNDVSTYVSCDGMNRIALEPGGTLRIKKHEKYLSLIHPEDYSYFSTLREKLGWERRAMRT